MQYYPATNTFPPPPADYGPPIAHNEYHDPYAQPHNPYAAPPPAQYNPAEYTAPPVAQPPPAQPLREQYTGPTYYPPRDPNTPAAEYYPPQGQPTAQGYPPPPGRNNPENVSRESYDVGAMPAERSPGHVAAREAEAVGACESR